MFKTQGKAPDAKTYPDDLRTADAKRSGGQSDDLTVRYDLGIPWSKTKKTEFRSEHVWPRSGNKQHKTKGTRGFRGFRGFRGLTED